ncbi:hypothetical protein P4B35_09415 [Pontiellaceae bacterium B12227]|nr:hypothetical protein [Pontiellaceae bacterium B12227]
MIIGERLHSYYGIFCITLLIFLSLIISGCGDTEQDIADPYPDMQADLRLLQGSWVDVNTNDSIECTTVFQDHTIRIRYQKSPEQPLQKQNGSIERLDEQRKLIIINGGAGACNYTFLEDQNLMLEFFTSDGWHIVHLRRAD